VTAVSAAAVASGTVAIVAAVVAVTAVNRVVAAMVVVVARTVPRAGTDKETADEPVRAVVSIRRTSIGSVVIVAIRAYRRSRVVGILIGILVGVRVSRIGRNADSHTH
jgi:hypothetical protein